jgi:MerR family transcriptional regulator/heat shock protein HspR
MALDTRVLEWYLKPQLAKEVKLPLEMKKPPDSSRVASVLVEAPADHTACFPIGIVADLLGVTEQTLRLYEVQGLVRPSRRNRERYYCAGDVQWLECLRRFIHREKVSIEGVKRLLHFAACWEIAGRREDFPCERCPVFRDRSGGPVANGEGRRGALAE